MRSWLVWSCIVAWAFTGCRRESTEQLCAQQLDRLQTRVAATQGRLRLGRTPKIKLAPATDARAMTDRGVDIVVTPRAVHLGGTRVENRGVLSVPEEAATTVQQPITEATISRLASMQYRKGWQPPVYLWVDRTVTLARLAPILRAVPGPNEIRAVVARSDDRKSLAPAPGTPDWVTTRLKKLKSAQPPEAAHLFASAIDQLVRDGTCADFADMLEEAKQQNTTDTVQWLAKRSTEVLQRCSCQINVDGWEALLLALAGANEAPVGWLPLVPRAAVSARNIKLPQVATFDDLAAQLSRLPESQKGHLQITH